MILDLYNDSIIITFLVTTNAFIDSSKPKIKYIALTPLSCKYIDIENLHG